MIRLQIDKPTTSIKHLCDNCAHSSRMTGPGYDRYFCNAIATGFSGKKELFQLVSDCTMYSPLDNVHEGMLPGQMKLQARHITRVNGRLEVLSPEEFMLWDWATDHGEKFELQRG